HLLLELVDGERAVEDDEVVGVHHFVVLLKDACLEEFETFGALVGEAEVHAGFVIFQFGATAEDAVDGDYEGSAEIEGDVGDGSEAVEVAEPAMGAATGSVAGEGGIDVAI